MNINGFYSVRFQTPLGFGTGTVFLRDGELLGGDASIAYKGKYTISATGDIQATVETVQHTEGISVFGNYFKKVMTIQIVGKFVGDTLSGKGTVPGVPVALDVQMRKAGDY